MNLSRKTFLYSAIISTVLISLMIGYFVFMLPSLYVDYVRKGNFNLIKDVHTQYMEEKSYQHIKLKNPMGTFTLDIPEQGNYVTLVNKYASVKISTKDEEIIDLLKDIRYMAKNMEDMDDTYESFEDEFKAKWDFNHLKDLLLGDSSLTSSFPLDFQIVKSMDNFKFKEISSKMYPISDNLFVYEWNGTDGASYYTTYMAMGVKDGGITISMMPVITPQIDEIRPIVLQSLPMILAVGFLLILLATNFFAKTIVRRIVELASHAEYIKESGNLDVEPIHLEGRDEIALLGEMMNELYSKLLDNYRELEEKNSILSDQNKRQEVFLRASSHQLKTPVAAALLLVDGMIAEIGKYKDTKTYLPQVKQQLQSMQRMIEDILYLNNREKQICMERFDVMGVITSCLNAYEIQIKEKNLSIDVIGNSMEIEADREITIKIIDNLISNAVNYTQDGGRIQITTKGQIFGMFNKSASIPEDIQPHIYEPFVSSNVKKKGHGLGLYVVAYYCKLMNFGIEVRNEEGGVKTVLRF
ncbi:MAG TPA: HAMP domain-containing sensor histidine kinase [Lachnospiraceae bacterium]|nr:HAMP domain-containing sensor histidine kinase [Lachnospiraceae bacterium]